MSGAERTVAPSQSGRSHVLDGLRGYAAVAVIFYHTLLAPLHNQHAELLYNGIQKQTTVYGRLLKIAVSILNGEVAVYIFFVISGIVLFRALEAMHKSDSTEVGVAWRFLVRRVLRIWPVMAACLMTKFLVFHQINMIRPNTVAAPSAEDLIINLWLIRFPVQGATWTLFVELAGVPIFLLCFLFFRRLGAWSLVIPLLYSLIAILKYHALMFNSHELMGGAPFLIAGMAIAAGWLNPLFRSPARFAAMPIALLTLLCNVLFVSAYENFQLHYLGLLFSLALLVAVVYLSHEGPTIRFLSLPLSQYFGRTSYSLYLWNVPIFELLFLFVSHEFARANIVEVGLVVGIVTTALTAPIASLSERWLEQPCIRLGRMLTRPPAAADLGAAATAGFADGATARNQAM